jgi:hypothetical protein
MLTLILWAVVTTIAAVVGWAGLIEAQQCATRAQERATVAIAAARAMRDERDEWKAQAEGVDRLRAAVRAAAADETPVHDRLVTEAMEREFRS